GIVPNIFTQITESPFKSPKPSNGPVLLDRPPPSPWSGDLRWVSQQYTTIQSPKHFNLVNLNMLILKVVENLLSVGVINEFMCISTK
ncbi:hypothetical protein MN116_008991, partial [Schistosoma mekongi]